MMRQLPLAAYSHGMLCVILGVVSFLSGHEFRSGDFDFERF